MGWAGKLIKAEAEESALPPEWFIRAQKEGWDEERMKQTLKSRLSNAFEERELTDALLGRMLRFYHYLQQKR